MKNRPVTVGITGQSGFIGTHLSRFLSGQPEEFRLIPFEDSFFDSEKILSEYAAACDVVLHLAAVNRSADQQALYDTNIGLAQKLVRALGSCDTSPGVIYASSIREGEDTHYGRAKQACREKLEAWAFESRTRLLTLRIPNAFGPGAPPFYNSFIATFSHLLIHGGEPKVTEERLVPLICVKSLCRVLAGHIVVLADNRTASVMREEITPDFHMTVRDVLEHLRHFHRLAAAGTEFESRDPDLLNLYEAFLSYTGGSPLVPRGNNS